MLLMKGSSSWVIVFKREEIGAKEMSGNFEL